MPQERELIAQYRMTAASSGLTFSAFRLNADMGLATAIIIFVALVVDFLFLPAFLLLMDKNRTKI